MSSSANIRAQRVLCFHEARTAYSDTHVIQRGRGQRGQKTHEMLSQRRTLMNCSFPQQ